MRSRSTSPPVREPNGEQHRNCSAYSQVVSTNADAAAQVQAVLTRVNAQLDILRLFHGALTRSEIPTLSLVGFSAHLDQLEAAAAALAADPRLTASVVHISEAGAQPPG